MGQFCWLEVLGLFSPFLGLSFMTDTQPTVSMEQSLVPAETLAVAETQEAVPQQEPATLAPVPAEQATCAKCQQQGNAGDMKYRASYRPELRYTCKNCMALETQLNRHGLQPQKLLSEQDCIAFFQQASLEKKNAEENRLCFSRARALLKQSMVTESKRIWTDTQGGEYQPLSFWELRGYNTQSIMDNAPKELHPILGETYKVEIHAERTELVEAEVESRIAAMEHDARQRALAASAASSSADPDPSHGLDLPIEINLKPAGGKKRGLSEGEKAEAKRRRDEQRLQEKDRKTATAAAAKMLPQIHKLHEKLEQKTAAAGDALDTVLSAADKEFVLTATKGLADAAVAGKRLLDLAAKGRIQEAGPLPWRSDKDLQQRLRDGNAALRSLQDAIRGDKPKPKGKAKAKAKAMA